MAPVLAVVILLGVLAFPLFLFRTVRRAGADLVRYGSPTGSVLQARVSHVHGEVQGVVGSSLVQARLRVLGLEGDPPRVALEFQAGGPAFLRVWPISFELAEAESFASWLDQAAGGSPGTAPGGGWGFYRATVFHGADVRSAYGCVERFVGRRRWRAHVVRVDDPAAPVGVAMRATLRFLRDEVSGCLVREEEARTLARLLRDASAAARAGTLPTRSRP